jgi:hypothetical protein
MTLGRASAVLAAIVLTAAAVPGALRAAELTDASYQKWRDHVLPEQRELGYRAIPWRASFWEAVVEAQEKDKPILLWAMNGHPLACT